MKHSKIPPLAFEDLKRLFVGPSFRVRLKRAADITWNGDVETQFTIARAVYLKTMIYGDVPVNDLGVSNPYISAPGGIDDSVEENALKKGLNASNIFPIITVHSHPAGCVAPSESDLKNLVGLRKILYDCLDGKIDYSPIAGIVALTYDNKRDLDLLLIQIISKEPHEFVAIDGHYSVEQKLGLRIGDNRAVAEAYDSLKNFNAALLRYFRHGNRTYRMLEEDLSKLEKFAFAPRILSQQSLLS